MAGITVYSTLEERVNGRKLGAGEVVERGDVLIENGIFLSGDGFVGRIITQHEAGVIIRPENGLDVVLPPRNRPNT